MRRRTLGYHANDLGSAAEQVPGRDVGADPRSLADRHVDDFEVGSLLVRLGTAMRLVLRLPGSGDELEMDLLKEALGPGSITVQLADGARVRAVSLDAVGLKARPGMTGS